jgi:tetratricopeptide (TPR) repeat protein
VKKRRPRPEAARASSPAGPDRSGRGLDPRWWFAAVLVVTFLIYLPGLEYGFVFDDHNLVEDNPAVASLPTAVQHLVTLHVGYRPVRTLSYALDYALGGKDPLVFHLSNLLFHLLVLLALGWVLRETGLTAPVVWIALAAFAVHPVHTDAVTYISGRRDLLSALFTLLAFGSFLRFRRSGRILWWGPVIACFGLAFLSKEMGIVVPVLILLYDWIRAASEEPGPAGPVRGLFRALRKGVWYYIPIFLLAAGMAAYKLWIAPASGKLVWWGGTLLTNLLTVAKVLCYDIFLLVLPLTLRADYSYASFPVAYSVADPWGWVAVAAVLLVLGGLLWRAARGDFPVAFWGMWFFAALLPVAHIVPHHELLAEHYLYLPSAGAFVLAALGLRRLWAWQRAAAVGAATAAALLWLGVGLAHRPVYRDDFTLFSDVLAKAPDCVRANAVLADHYFARGEYGRAEMYYRRVLAIPPQFEREGLHPDKQEILKTAFQRGGGDYLNREAGYSVNAYRRLAFICESGGRLDEATRLYREGSELRALADMFYLDLGNLAARQSRFAEAEKWYRRALAASPQDPMILCNLAAACSEQRRFDEARHYLLTAVTLNPNFYQAYYNLALLLGRLDAPPADVADNLDKALRTGLPEPERSNALAILERLQAASGPAGK